MTAVLMEVSSLTDTSDAGYQLETQLDFLPEHIYIWLSASSQHVTVL